MTWQGVPWAVGRHAGGAPETPAEAARAVAYYASDGAEGPATGSDCAVRAMDAPTGAVRIMPGTLAMLNRFPGGAGQSYIARQPEAETVAITATGTAARTDLVCVVVEDPQYAGQPAPANAATGPYVRTRVFEGVGDGVTRLDQVAPNQTGYALARIAMPASTAAVQQSYITDLRAVANPRTQQVTKLVNIGDAADDVLASTTMERFPQQAGWAITVPRWAVKAHLELYVSGVRVKDDATAGGDWRGRARLKLGTIATADSELNPPPPDTNKTDVFTYMCAGELSVPAAMRGTTQTLEAMALRSGGTGGVTVAQGTGTTAIAKVTFYEDASTDAFTV